jgi:hypothetical protein
MERNQKNIFFILIFIKFLYAYQATASSFDKDLDSNIVQFKQKGFMTINNLCTGELFERGKSEILKILKQGQELGISLLKKREPILVGSKIIIPNGMKYAKVIKIERFSDDRKGKINYHLEYMGAKIVIEVMNGKAFVDRIVWAPSIAACLLEISRHKNVLKTVSQILNTNYAEHIISSIHFKEPYQFRTSYFPIHQDIQNRRRDGNFKNISQNTGQGNNNYVAITHNFTKMNKENGGLFICNILLDKDIMFDKTQILDLPIEIQESIKNPKFLDLEENTLEAHNEYMLHGSGYNLSPNIRILCIYGYSTVIKHQDGSFEFANHARYIGKHANQIIELSTGRILIKRGDNLIYKDTNEVAGKIKY